MRHPVGRRRGQGYDYLQVASDVCSRVAFVQAQPDETGATTDRFLHDAAAFVGQLDVEIERVMTDRTFAYTRARSFQRTVRALGARHGSVRTQGSTRIAAAAAPLGMIPSGGRAWVVPSVR